MWTGSPRDRFHRGQTCSGREPTFACPAGKHSPRRTVAIHTNKSTSFPLQKPEGLNFVLFTQTHMNAREGCFSRCVTSDLFSVFPRSLHSTKKQKKSGRPPSWRAPSYLSRSSFSAAGASIENFRPLFRPEEKEWLRFLRRNYFEANSLRRNDLGETRAVGFQ